MLFGLGPHPALFTSNYSTCCSSNQCLAQPLTHWPRSTSTSPYFAPNTHFSFHRIFAQKPPTIFISSTLSTHLFNPCQLASNNSSPPHPINQPEFLPPTYQTFQILPLLHPILSHQVWSPLNLTSSLNKQQISHLIIQSRCDVAALELPESRRSGDGRTLLSWQWR